LGGDIFAGKYMHEKLTKWPNFTIFARKIFFPNFGGKFPCAPSPTPMIAAMPYFVSCHCRPVQRHLPTFAFSQIGDKDACFLATLILLGFTITNGEDYCFCQYYYSFSFFFAHEVYQTNTKPVQLWTPSGPKNTDPVLVTLTHFSRSQTHFCAKNPKLQIHITSSFMIGF